MSEFDPRHRRSRHYRPQMLTKDGIVLEAQDSISESCPNKGRKNAAGHDLDPVPGTGEEIRSLVAERSWRGVGIAERDGGDPPVYRLRERRQTCQRCCGLRFEELRGEVEVEGEVIHGRSPELVSDVREVGSISEARKPERMKIMMTRATRLAEILHKPDRHGRS